MRLVSRRCGYKYVLLGKSNKVKYEELVEFESNWDRGYVDRCLVIKEEYVTKNSK